MKSSFGESMAPLYHDLYTAIRQGKPLSNHAGERPAPGGDSGALPRVESGLISESVDSESVDSQ
ncbi:MAG: hypothetical protein R2867_38690 [Caldilineaceae bacterium]